MTERKLKFSMFNPTGKHSKVIKDTMRIVDGKTELVFNGQHFVKTDQHDRESIDRIEAYRSSNRY
jgi:hypothetical protein